MKRLFGSLLLVGIAVACSVEREPNVPGPTVAIPPALPTSIVAVAPADAIPPDNRFDAIAPAVEAAISAGDLPGCVIEVGTRERILFRQAYGSKSIEPEGSAPRSTKTSM